MIIFAAAVIVGGTGAFFSDTETSSGNVFTAGSVTIEINDLAHNYNGDAGNAPIFDTIGDGFSFSLTDLKPLDGGNVEYTLDNGENEAYVCAMVEETGNNENTVLEPETAAGDTSDDGAGFGELGDLLSFKFGTESGTLEDISGMWQSLGVVAANNPTNSVIDYCFGVYDGINCVLDESAAYNVAQTDGLTADVHFYAVQTRNNPDFECSDLNPPVWEETNQAGGDASFIEELPRGNVLQLTTLNDVASRVRWTNDSLDLDLDAFTGISFESKQVSAIDAVNGNATMRLVIDLDGDTNTADTQEITYEPYYNIAAHNALNDASILANTWQTWDTTLANGKFWGNGGFLGTTPSGGAYATNVTLQQVLTAYPDAKIVAISLGMGTYNVGQVILVDNLMINGSPVSLEN